MTLPEQPRPRRVTLGQANQHLAFDRVNPLVPMPNLNDIQRQSFNWFLTEGLAELFAERSPIQDPTGRTMDLELGGSGLAQSEASGQ
jgi:DNA-directed RNA polymerase subunit beta